MRSPRIFWNTGEYRQMSMNGRSRTLPAAHGTDTQGCTSPVTEIAQLPRAQLQGNRSSVIGWAPSSNMSRSGPR